MKEIFQYRKVGEGLLAELQSRIEAGDSLALISPRHGGARYAMYLLDRRLRAEGTAPVVFLRLSYREPVSGEAELRDRIYEAVGCMDDRNLDTLLYGEPPLLGAVDRLSARDGRAVVLLVGSVDSLPYSLTRRLLEEIRSRVQQGRSLVAVLGGEANFSDLVHGPRSEFDCVERYVLQGLDQDVFAGFLDPYCQSVPIRFSDPGAAYRLLWEQTGGNRHLLRMILWDILERRMRSGWDGENPIETRDLQSLLAGIHLPGIYGTEIFDHAVRLIDHEPGCWADLQTLLDGVPVVVESAKSPPVSLELAGAAIRRKESFEGEEFWFLRFASPLMAGFIRRQYSDRRWGDLYTQNGQLDRAFEFYRKIPWSDGARPSTTDDRIDTELTVRSLSAPLFATVSQGSQEVRSLFARCCHFVLGYRDVAFWKLHGGNWRLEEQEGFFSSGIKSIESQSGLLRGQDRASAGLFLVPLEWRKHVIAAVLPAYRREERCAVVLGDFTSQAFISRQRANLTNDFVVSFIAAYTRALEVEQMQDRLSVRDRHLEVINSIFDALGSSILDVEHALRVAAGGLRDLGYRRVLFCLVNPEGDRIQGVLDASDDPKVDVAQMTDWPLADPMADLQPYVIHTGRDKVVEDPSREPLANPKVLKSVPMKAFAIVPLLSPGGEAIGTVHVERTDGAVPSKTEVEDLLGFGRQLAIAIEQSERVNLLQSALNQMPEPVLITGRNHRLRYANKPAADLLELKADWRDRNKAERLSLAQLGRAIFDLLDNSLRQGGRNLRHVHQVGRRDYHGAALADAIPDWRGETAGALLHIEDLNYLYRVLAAIQVVAQAADTDSAMWAMLQAARILGHESGRLFLVDKDDRDLLTAQLSLDSERGIVEPTQKTRLPRRRDQEHRTWNCIEARVPIVVCWKIDCPDMAKVVTPWGLEAINSNPPRCPDEIDKNEGDFWIDFPLISHQGVELGKLTLSCDETLRPEEFELLKFLSWISAGLFDAFLFREQMVEEKQDRAARGAVDETMSLAAHNVATRLASLPILLARYRQREVDMPDLRELNDEFRDLHQELMPSIHRIKERFGPVKVHRACFDLLARVRSVLQGALPPESWSLWCSKDSLNFEGDSHLLGNALLELIANSRELAPSLDALRVDMSLDLQSLKSGYWVQIIYQDNGPGVPVDLKQNIFKPFFTRRPGRRTSTGLGLTFVRRVVDGHDGNVQEIGVPGEGAKFIIALPYLFKLEETGHDAFQVSDHGRQQPDSDAAGEAAS